ncbi:MAG TPA: LytR C-terminal domain-containing protein [Candidatus Woesebacteria bacterium]|nr:LytR C-terminal domain-containing protein [Candidatus Woesebacteria bacterium]
MKSIIYIDRANLYFYGGNVHAPLLFAFKPTTIRDIEVINAEEFESELNGFIKDNKIEPSDVMIVVAHQSSFEKLIDPKTPADQVEIQKKQFLDNVPFEQTLSKSFKTDKEIKIIAINKDLVYLIRDIFNKNQFNVVTISSIASLFPEGDITFNAATAQQILSKSSIFKQNMFLLQDIEVPTTDTFEETYGKEKKNMTLYYSIPAFVVLIGILVWLMIGQRNARNKRSKNISPTPVQQQILTTPTVPVSPIASESALIIPKDSVTIRILNGSGIAGQADEVSTALEQKDYEQITTGNAPTLQSSGTLIIFKSRIPTPQREEIVNAVSEIVGEVTTQQNEEIDTDILITTAAPQLTSTPSP